MLEYMPWHNKYLFLCVSCIQANNSGIWKKKGMGRGKGSGSNAREERVGGQGGMRFNRLANPNVFGGRTPLGEL